MNTQPNDRKPLTLFLCGDVMTGRGIDQILPHPSAPQLHEPYVSSAYEYVELAQRAHGVLTKAPDFAYVWGDSLTELERQRPVLRIVNLETAITTCDDACSGKAIHYRMNPKNVGCLTAAGFDCCVLANNHTMDWGREGLEQTLHVLRQAGMRTAGAGPDLAAAYAPARFDLWDRRGVLVFACGTADSGISNEWAATDYRSGLCMLDELSPHSVEEIAARIRSCKRAGDIVVVSLHWGRNWGYEVSDAQRRFAQQLIDVAGADVVHGHSSHHPKPIEVYRGKLILYGCGDLLNDYEGIGGYARYRPELGLMYFAQLDPDTGELVRLSMTPTCIRRLQVNRADRGAAGWLCTSLTRESHSFGTKLQLQPDNTLALLWSETARASASKSHGR